MELNWSTFILEIINFLVLVWILKRFLYRPVLNAIARRRADIDKSLEDARKTREQAEAMKVQYNNRLRDWEKEKEAAHETLRREIGAERERLTAELHARLDQEQERLQVIEERHREDVARRTEEQAMQQASTFASRLLARIAGPELEDRLVEAAIADLAGLSAEQRTVLHGAWNSANKEITVMSAYPLREERLEALNGALASLLDEERIAVEAEINAALVAGLRISIGPWLLRANLQDDLVAFAEAAHAAE